MVEIKLNPETPSQAIVKAGNTEVTFADAQGRQITIKRMNALDRMRLFEVVGADNIGNQAYFGYASLACHVTKIGEYPVIRPATKAQLEALVQQLDDDGLNAVAKAVAENFITKDEADQKELVKNG